MKHFLIAACALALSTLAAAQVYVIDFEQLHSGGNWPEDVPDPLVLYDVGGSGVDVTIGASNGDLWVQDLGQSLLGNRYSVALLANRLSAHSYPENIWISFSVPVQSVSLTAGDGYSDWDSPLTLVANGSNGIIDSDSSDYRDGPFQLLSVSGAGITNVIYDSGGIQPCSTYIDDVSFSLDSGPKLYVPNLEAGESATVSVTDATPGGQVIIGYSLTGAGPSNVPLAGCGVMTALLTNPQFLASGTTDASGSFSYMATLPPSLSGATVWFHAVDVASCQTTTNGYVRMVQ